MKYGDSTGCKTCGGKGVLSISDICDLGMSPAKDYPTLVRAPTNFPSWYCIRSCWIGRGSPRIIPEPYEGTREYPLRYAPPGWKDKTSEFWKRTDRFKAIMTGEGMPWCECSKCGRVGQSSFQLDFYGRDGDSFNCEKCLFTNQMKDDK